MNGGERFFLGGDEAGNPKGPGYFVVALVASKQPRVISEELNRLREKRHLPEDFIFSFHESSNAVRSAFLSTLSSLPLQAWALVVDKGNLEPRHDTRQSLEIWGEFMADLILRLPSEIVAGAIITLHDYDNPRKAERFVRRVLSKRIDNPQRRAKRIRCRPARSQALVQCADMVAGAIYRHYTHNDSRFYDRIESKLEDLWDF